ncbi:MAG: C39 family peptidase [Patescibacteria group bacterium]
MTRQKNAPATKKRGSRRRPPNKKIVYIDDYENRQRYPDLDIINWRNRHGESEAMKRIPPGEIWIDHRFEAETEFLLRIYRAETMRRFASRTDYKPVREYMKKKLCEDGPVPPLVEREEHDKANDLTICYVRGNIVRRYHDPAFIFGGHDLVYDYIPKRTVWIDIRQDPREIKYTLLHETRERKWMERGMSYDKAHKRATEIELMARARKNIIRPVGKINTARKPTPLNIPLYSQSETACGPASLKMVLDFFDKTYRAKPYTEKHLSVLCDMTAEGTNHAPLVSGAKKVSGASVFTKENGTLNELKYFVLQERLPVIVGWWSKFGLGPDDPPDTDCGHFSIIRHISTKYVYLADPWFDEIEKAGVRKIPIRDFMGMWHDTDTPANLPVKRWYMVLNFEGKSFRILGGANY